MKCLYLPVKRNRGHLVGRLVVAKCGKVRNELGVKGESTERDY